jgi:hypothetical protein
VEPFHARCFGDDPAVWAVIDSYYERAYRWDMGGENGRPYTSSDVDDAVALARWLLFTFTGEQWYRAGVGYGDRYRALQLIRGRLRRMHWRDRVANHGGRRAQRRYRAYRASMSIAAPNPATVAMAVERATREGVTGRRPGAGRPGMVTRQLTEREARVAIIGEPMAEVVMDGRAVSGGVAHIETDGKMREVVTRTVAFTFHTGERVGGHWVPDGGAESLAELETAWQMVSGTTRVEYHRTFVADALDAGTEVDKHTPAPLPTPDPWTDEQRSNVTTRRAAADRPAPQPGEWVEIPMDRTDEYGAVRVSPSRVRHWVRAE